MWLHHDVHLHSVLVAKVVEPHVVIPPTGLATQFLHHEGFQQLLEQEDALQQRHVVLDGRTAQLEWRGEIAHVQ